MAHPKGGFLNGNDRSNCGYAHTDPECKFREARIGGYPRSKLKEELARILKDEGFIRDYKVIEDNKQGIIRIYLKYDPAQGSVIRG